MGYFEIESVDNLCEIVVAVNPKEYYEHFEEFRCNKKQKGIRKCVPGMNLVGFTKRIVFLNETENFEKPKCKYYQEQQKFPVVRREMPKTVIKTNFSQTNEKRFYSPNGITSLPMGYM